MQAMRASKYADFPPAKRHESAENGMYLSNLSLFISSSSLSLVYDNDDENENEKKTVRRIRRTSERVELRQSHDGSSIKIW